MAHGCSVGIEPIDDITWSSGRTNKVDILNFDMIQILRYFLWHRLTVTVSGALTGISVMDFLDKKDVMTVVIVRQPLRHHIGNQLYHRGPRCLRYSLYHPIYQCIELSRLRPDGLCPLRACSDSLEDKGTLEAGLDTLQSAVHYVKYQYLR